ncbi:MAG: aminoglycoside phosphotransferase family protein [Candidatus Nanohaloarchaea archaeon]
MDDELAARLREHPDFPGDFKVAGREKGENNFNFVVKGREEKYVVRVPRGGGENRLKSEARMLEFLEQQGIENVPTRILYLEDYPALVESFAGGMELESENLTGARLENLASLLARIHSIPVDRYNEFFDSDRPRKTTLEKVYREDFEKWSRKRLEEYLELAENPDERLEEYSERQRELFESADLDIEVPHAVTHGDLSHNIRGSGDRVYIIDWELGRVGYPVHDLLYFLHWQELEAWQEEKLISAYREHRDLPGYEKTKDIYPKFLSYNDTIWAANRMVKAEGDEKERFRQMFQERMERLENMYREV